MEKALIGLQDNKPLADALKRYREITNEILELISNDGEQSRELIEALEAELYEIKTEVTTAFQSINNYIKMQLWMQEK